MTEGHHITIETHIDNAVAHSMGGKYTKLLLDGEAVPYLNRFTIDFGVGQDNTITLHTIELETVDGKTRPKHYPDGTGNMGMLKQMNEIKEMYLIKSINAQIVLDEA